MALDFSTHIGAEILHVLQPLARLRIAVFRDFPYLYEGSIAYELDYLQTYVRSSRAMVYAAWDGTALIGATTCIPLADETADVQAPFKAAGMDIDSIFYFGESVLLPAYRGQGLGHRFMDVRETHAWHYGGYTMTCFCAVQRPEDHPLRPVGYRPLDGFWQSRHYTKRSDLQTTMRWQDIDAAEETDKPMTFWTKFLHPSL
jgi:GNAT superfamily N-acetyltransferase